MTDWNAMPDEGQRAYLLTKYAKLLRHEDQLKLPLGGEP